VDAQLPEPHQVKPRRSLATSIVAYSLVVATAYMCLGLLYMLGVTRSPAVQFVLASLTLLFIYAHLAHAHSDRFLAGAIGTTLAGSALCSLIDALGTNAKPLKTFVTFVVLNAVIGSLVGTLYGLRQLKPPANNRWRGP